MLETSARLLSLLGLFQARRTWAGGELAERLGVTGRTLRRDVERLRVLGYEVEATSGPGGGYRFGGAGSALPPLLLTEDEAVTLSVALRTIVLEGGASAERALEVLAKLDRALPLRLRDRATAVADQTLVLAGAERVDPGLLARLAGACRDSEAVHLRYRPREREAGERVVWPLRLAHTGNRRWYLVAWDEARGAWRTLRVDRIEALLAVGPRVVRPDPPPDLERYVSDAIAHAPYACRGEIELDGPRDVVLAQIPPWVGVSTEAGPGRTRLAIGGPSWDVVVAQAVLTGLPFRVVGPPALQDAVDALRVRLDASRFDVCRGADAGGQDP